MRLKSNLAVSGFSGILSLCCALTSSSPNICILTYDRYCSAVIRGRALQIIYPSLTSLAGLAGEVGGGYNVCSSRGGRGEKRESMEPHPQQAGPKIP
jgi:hypothetical protein